MTTVRLSIEPKFCGPASAGTVEIIKLVQLHAQVSLTEAKRLVDGCVFDKRFALIAMPSLESAKGFIRAVSSLPGAAEMKATMENGQA